jgi:hypothetical protein
MPERHIARAMTMHVVDQLESINVREHQHELLPTAQRQRPVTRELFLQPVAQRQTGQRVVPRAARKDLGLEACEIGHQRGLPRLEHFQIRRVAATFGQEVGAQRPHGVVHALMLFEHPQCGLRIDLLELLAVSHEPLSETAAEVGIGGQDIVAGRRP